jgi:hypothetical protein
MTADEPWCTGVTEPAGRESEVRPESVNIRMARAGMREFSGGDGEGIENEPLVVSRVKRTDAAHRGGADHPFRGRYN